MMGFLDMYLLSNMAVLAMKIQGEISPWNPWKGSPQNHPKNFPSPKIISSTIHTLP